MLLSTEGVFYYFDFCISGYCENTNLQTSRKFTIGAFFLIHVLYHIITYVLDVELNLKIGMPRITPVGGQPAGLLPLVVILF